MQDVFDRLKTQGGKPVFYYTDESGTEKSFKTEQRRPSAKVRDDVAQIFASYDKKSIDMTAPMMAEMREAQQKQEENGSAVTFDEAQLKALSQASMLLSPEKGKTAIDLTLTTRRMSDQRTIEVCKAIVVTEKLPEPERDMINSEFESKFWQDQDLEAIEVWVDMFCKRNGLR